MSEAKSTQRSWPCAPAFTACRQGAASRRQRPRHPKAEVVESRVPGIPKPQRGAQELGKLEPRAAAYDAEFAIARPGRTVGGCGLVAVVPAVLRPLPHIAVHLVEAPRVWRESIDRHRLPPIGAFRAAAIGEIAVVVGLVGRDRAAPPERCRRAG